MRSVSDVELVVFQSDVSVAILALLSHSLFPREKVLEVANRREVEKLFKGEVEVQPFLHSQPGLVPAVHVFHLLEVVSNIGPKLVIFILRNLRLHEGELLAEECSYVSRGVFFSLEIEPRKVDKS